MRRLLRSAVVALVAMTSGCAAVGGAALGGLLGTMLPLRTHAPLPADLAVSAPGPEIPVNLAAFSGAWVGETKREVHPPRRHVLVVEKIISPHDAGVVFALDGIPNVWGIGFNKASAERVSASFDGEGTLSVQVGGWQASYSLKDGELVAELTHPFGGREDRLQATLHRVDLARLVNAPTPKE